MWSENIVALFCKQTILLGTINGFKVRNYHFVTIKHKVIWLLVNINPSWWIFVRDFPIFPHISVYLFVCLPISAYSLTKRNRHGPDIWYTRLQTISKMFFFKILTLGIAHFKNYHVTWISSQILYCPFVILVTDNTKKYIKL